MSRRDEKRLLKLIQKRRDDIGTEIATEENIVREHEEYIDELEDEETFLASLLNDEGDDITPEAKMMLINDTNLVRFQKLYPGVLGDTPQTTSVLARVEGYVVPPPPIEPDDYPKDSLFCQNEREG